MATLARTGRPLSSRVQRAYRLEMAGRTVFVLLLLLALTGLVIFYLGVITGKGLRDPNQPAPEAARGPAAPAPPAPAGEAKPAPAPTALNHALQAPAGQIEGLKKEESTAGQQSQQLLSRAKQELALDEVQPKSALPPAPPKVAAPTVPAALPPAPPAPATAQLEARPAAQPAPRKQQAPAATRAATPPAPAAPADSEGIFTVQVFSSPQQQHAQDILADLKKRGFPAYMNQFQAADNRTWYRVRIGKGTRQEADALANRVRRATHLQDLRVLKP